MSLSPEKLRACARQSEHAPFAPISAKECEMLADAMEIADSCARADIETECRHAGESDAGQWWDTSSIQMGGKRMVKQAIRYLESRGLLIRKDGEPHVVSFRGAE